MNGYRVVIENGYREWLQRMVIENGYRMVIERVVIESGYREWLSTTERAEDPFY